MYNEYSVDPWIRLSLSLIQSVPLFTPFFPPCATFHWVTKASRWLVLNGRISSSNHFSSSSSFPFTLSARKKIPDSWRKKRNPDCQQNNKLVFIRTLWWWGDGHLFFSKFCLKCPRTRSYSLCSVFWPRSLKKLILCLTSVVLWKVLTKNGKVSMWAFSETAAFCFAHPQCANSEWTRKKCITPRWNCKWGLAQSTFCCISLLVWFSNCVRSIVIEGLDLVEQKKLIGLFSDFLLEVMHAIVQLLRVFLLKNAIAYMIKPAPMTISRKLSPPCFPKMGGVPRTEQQGICFVTFGQHFGQHLYPTIIVCSIYSRMSRVNNLAGWRESKRNLFGLNILPPVIIFRWLIRSWALQPTRKIRDSFQMLTLITCN